MPVKICPNSYMNQSELLRFYKKNKDKLKHCEIKKSNLKDIAGFPVSNNQCYYVLNYQKLSIEFCRGIEKMLGYNDTIFNIDQLLQLIHPDDAPLVNRLMEASLNFSLENDVSSDVSFVSTYRVKHKNGDTKHVMRQSSVFETDKNGKIISSFSLLTDISFMNLSMYVNWEFIAPGLDKAEFTKTINKTVANMFTPRELDVIKFLNNGFTSEKISEILHLSKHTVDTHRRRILRKANCDNTIELIVHCKSNGIL